MNKAPARLAQGQGDGCPCNHIGLYPAIFAQIPLHERVEQRPSDNPELLRRTAVILALAEQQAGTQHIQPVKADFAERAVGLTFHLEVELLGMGVCPDRADRDEAFDAMRFCSLSGGNHQFLIDGTKGILILASLLPCRAQCTDHGGWLQRLDHLTPFIGIGNEHFHPCALGQRRFPPRDGAKPNVRAGHTKLRHSPANKAGCSNQSKTHGGGMKRRAFVQR